MFFDAFDTATELTAFCRDREEFDSLSAGFEEELLRFHRLFDIYDSYDGINNIKSINDAAGKAPVKVDQDIIALLKLGIELYDETGGKVNIAMGSVLKLWRQARVYAANDPEHAYVPDKEKLLAAARHCNIMDIVIDEQAGTVYLADPEMSLDVGALAKDYAIEREAQKLEVEGRDHIAINAGGNVRTIGKKPDGSWRIGIKNPDMDSDKIGIASIELNGGSIVTSGVYERFFTIGEESYHHIIDGDTLFPEHRYLSVSIITADSGRADALSTALFNMDIKEGRAFIEALEGTEAVWVLNDGSVIVSSDSYITKK